MFKGYIYVTLKPGVLDPQGEAVKRSLGVFGYQGIEELRIGKFVEVLLTADSREAAEEQLKKMSDQLLANPVIEDYRVQVVEERS